jgi:phosphonate transport system substrate-binding protein
MKKLISVLFLFILTFALVACGGDDASDPDVIKVQFVPSNTASEIMLRTYVLERLLADEIPGKTFEISVGTDYNAVVEAMEAGQVHVGFLTAQQYAYVTTERPGTAEVILTSVRAALEVQLLPKADQIAAMNAAGYTGQKSTTETVTSYASILVTKTTTYNLVGAGKLNTIADLAGKTVCTQGQTSGAGYVYPAVLLDDNNLKFVTGTPNAANGEVKAISIGVGYPGAVTALMSGDCDAAFLFQDARDNTTLLAAYPNLFTDTRVVALSPNIYNDTISVIPTLKDSLKLAIQNAFIKIATTEEGLAAIAVYSHTGYKIAVDADYDGERVVYLFKKENLS